MSDKLPAAFSSNNYNTNYLFRLAGINENNQKVDIRASLPETFSFAISAEWEALLPRPEVGNNAFTRAVSRAVNVNFASQEATQLVWLSTTPVEFNLPLQFNAIYNEEIEVVNPVKELMKLILPTKTSELTLKIPGPGLSAILNRLRQNSTVTNSDGQVVPGPGAALAGVPEYREQSGSGTYDLTLYLGTRYKFTDIIVKSVAPVFESKFTENGHFIAANVDVTFSTSRMLVKQDIDRYFATSNLNTPDLANSFANIRTLPERN